MRPKRHRVPMKSHPLPPSVDGSGGLVDMFLCAVGGVMLKNMVKLDLREFKLTSLPISLLLEAILSAIK